MSLRNVMRKAAGLLVELPAEETTHSETKNDPAPAGDVKPNAGAEPDIEELLAVVRGPKSESAKPTNAAGGKAAAAPDVKPKPATTATAAQLAQAGKGPNLDKIKSAAADAVKPSMVGAGALAGDVKPNSGSTSGGDGKLKVSAVYETAGVPPTPFSAEQALELIQAMPKELPLDVKRQTVKATLSTVGKTLGANPQTIVADATRKLAALEAYLDSFSKQSGEFVAKVEDEIKALESQMAEKRKAIETARRRVDELSKLCDQEADRLDDVLEFFSLDVGPSKYAAPDAKADAVAQPNAPDVKPNAVVTPNTPKKS